MKKIILCFIFLAVYSNLAYAKIIERCAAIGVSNCIHLNIPDSAKCENIVYEDLFQQNQFKLSMLCKPTTAALLSSNEQPGRYEFTINSNDFECSGPRQEGKTCNAPHGLKINAKIWFPTGFTEQPAQIWSYKSGGSYTKMQIELKP